MVIKLEQWHDRYRTARSRPDRELVLGREDVVILAHLDEGLIAGLAAQLDRVLAERPELVVARRPDHLGISLSQQLQRFLNVAERLADIARHDQPVVAGFWAQVLDEQPVRPVRTVQIANRVHGSRHLASSLVAPTLYSSWAAALKRSDRCRVHK